MKINGAEVGTRKNIAEHIGKNTDKFMERNSEPANAADTSNDHHINHGRRIKVDISQEAMSKYRESIIAKQQQKEHDSR